MSDFSGQFPANIFSEGKTNVPLLTDFITEFNKVVRFVQAFQRINPHLFEKLSPQVHRITRDLGFGCDVESSGSNADDAERQYWNGTAFANSGDYSDIFEEPYGLPYDAEDIVVSFYHSQAGRRIPINFRSVRHVKTVSDGSYPLSSEAGNMIVYPFKFVRIGFTETPGTATPTFTEICSDTTYDGYFLNLYCEDDCYLDVGTYVWVYHVTSQWFTFASRSCVLQ